MFCQSRCCCSKPVRCCCERSGSTSGQMLQIINLLCDKYLDYHNNLRVHVDCTTNERTVESEGNSQDILTKIAKLCRSDCQTSEEYRLVLTQIQMLTAPDMKEEKKDSEPQKTKITITPETIQKLVSNLSTSGRTEDLGKMMNNLMEVFLQQ